MQIFIIKPRHRSNKKAYMGKTHSMGALGTCGKASTTKLEVNFTGIIAVLLLHNKDQQ